MKSLQARFLFSLIFALAIPTFAQTQFVPEICGVGSVHNSKGERVSWVNSLPIEIYLHESVPANLIPAITSAMKSWELALGRKVFELAGVVGGPAIPKKDGLWVIYYLTEWEDNRSSEQERTTIYWEDDEIREGDIHINAKNFNFSAGTDVVPTAIDFESLQLHALGHLQGLAHSNDRGAVMSKNIPLGVLRRDLDCSI